MDQTIILRAEKLENNALFPTQMKKYIERRLDYVFKAGIHLSNIIPKKRIINAKRIKIATI